MANQLSMEIQSCLRNDISKDDNDEMDAIRGILRDEYSYGRNDLNKIGNNPLKMFDEMSRKGHIVKRHANYEKLIKLLYDADLPEVAGKIEKLIDEYKCSQGGPQNLTMKGVKRESSYGEPATWGVDAKRRAYSSASSQEANVSSDGVFVHTGRKFYLSEENRVYNVEEGTRGLVAIINNFTTHKCKSLQRKGTLEDEDRINRFFTSGALRSQYEVSRCHDLNKEDFHLELERLAEMLGNEGNDFNRFFLFIMSHGDEAGVKTYYTDKEQAEESVISIEDILSAFSKCLRGCPKVFVIQACQGERDNTGEQVSADADRPDIQQPDELNGSANVEEVEGDNCIAVTVPDAADTVVAFATIRGYRSYRGKENYGSWFLKAFIEALEESHQPDKYFSSHLVDILTEVQYQVSRKKGRADSVDGTKGNTKVRVVQMPVFQSTLRKKFYLVPPILPK